MTNATQKSDESFQFPPGKKEDKFLISTPNGPAYIVTRGELEDASRKRISELIRVRDEFAAGGPIKDLYVDTIIGIKESTIIWPHNR